jgi:MYXO-CTERM domain-containing protein
MQSISRTAAAVILGAACTLPVMAQGTAGGNTGAGVGASSQPQATAKTNQSPTSPGSTASTTGSQSSAGQSDTKSMGAGPQMDDRPQGGEKKHDLGWLGLLGLVGLLGLRRKHDDHHVHTTTTDTRRPTTNY